MYGLIKRVCDFVVAFLFLMLLLPFLLIIAAILKFTAEGDVFYLQERIGKNNKPFHIYKFVTMRRNSEATGSITYAEDPRVLPFGKFLRKTKINEVPQIFNILKGEISIVGPRPLVADGFYMYPRQVQELIYKDNKPGLTGIGSLFFRGEEKILEKYKEDVLGAYKNKIMPVKGALELWYREHKSVWVDFKIFLLTALTVVCPNNDLYIKAFNNINQDIITRYKELCSEFN